MPEKTLMEVSMQNPMINDSPLRNIASHHDVTHNWNLSKGELVIWQILNQLLITRTFYYS